jgi:hypothetical protein
MSYPQSSLTALLDDLERELLSAQPDEVRAAWRGASRARYIARQEIRALLSEAVAASEEDSAAILSSGTYSRVDRSLGVSREHRATARRHPHANTFPALSCRRR